MARRTLPKPYQNNIDRDFVMSLVKELEEITGLVLMKGERIEVMLQIVQNLYLFRQMELNIK